MVVLRFNPHAADGTPLAERVGAEVVSADDAVHVLMLRVSSQRSSGRMLKLMWTVQSGMSR